LEHGVGQGVYVFDDLELALQELLPFQLRQWVRGEFEGRTETQWYSLTAEKEEN